ncbi:hypothetical protein LLH00_03900 [bacterium]|nr:hypothetical protein [bacterium]
MLRRCFWLCLTLTLPWAVTGLAAGEKCDTGRRADQTEAGGLESLPQPDKCVEQAIELSETVLAQLSDPEPGPPGPPGLKDMDPDVLKQWRAQRAEREKNIQMLQLWKIMQEVELRDDQLDRFFPLMREMQKSEHELAEQRHGLARSLRQELKKDDPDKKQLEKLSGQLIDNTGRLWQSKCEGMEKVMSILEPRQKAKFVLAVSGMERDLWEAIAQVRMNDPMLMSKFKFDRDQFDANMKVIQERMDKIKQQLREKGYPVDSDKGPN